MRSDRIFLFVLLITLALLVEDTQAGWKFWKKKDKDPTTTTTAAPEVPNPQPAPVTPAPAGAPTSTTVNTNRAVIGAGNPGLAIGVGSTGENIRNNAQPHRPNPGTEVGLDIPGSRPSRPGVGGNNGQGYRDWAADLTGAGQDPGRQPPRLPAQGPATGIQQPGSRPGSPSNSPVQPQPAPGIPGSQPSSPVPGSRPQTPTSNVPQQPPAGRQPPPLGPRPGSPISGQPGSGSPNPVGPPSPGSPSSPGSPGRTWADVAGGAGRPGVPTPPPRTAYPSQPISGQPQPGVQPGQTRPQSPQPGVQPGQIRPQSPQPVQPGQPRPQSPQPVQPGQSRPGQTRPGQLGPGALAGGALAAGALAGGAAAGATAGGASTGTTTNTGKVYSSNPTYSRGNTVTDEDLEKLSEALFIKDSNNVNRYITLNLQKKTTSSSAVDEAPQPLFSVNAAALQIPTIQRVIAIFDNYQLDTHSNEYISPAQREEESLLADTFLSTNVMSAAMRFLADKSFVRKDYYEYKDLLRRIWFNLFSRGEGKIGSTGFEHVFMTELKPNPTGTEVLGLHNWIYFSAEEAKRRADYLGYIKKVDLGDKGSIIKMHAKFDGHDKPVTTMFVGTSPELEMALYTVCFFARPDGNCPVSLGGTKFNIVTRKFRYRGRDLVGTAYPDIN